MFIQENPTEYGQKADALKNKTLGLIEDLNTLIKDTLLFPEYNGGFLELTLTDKNCRLLFKEGEKELLIINYDCSVENDTDYARHGFYAHMYWLILRTLFLTIDSYRPADEINGIPSMAFMNFRTLAFEGLKNFNK